MDIPIVNPRVNSTYDSPTGLHDQGIALHQESQRGLQGDVPHVGWFGNSIKHSYLHVLYHIYVYIYISFI